VLVYAMENEICLSKFTTNPRLGRTKVNGGMIPAGAL